MQERVGRMCLVVTVCLCGIVFAILFLTSAGVRKAEADAPAADKVEILFAGEKIYGLKGFSYEAHDSKRPVEDTGKEETVRAYGMVDVKGSILVNPNSELLNKHMENNTSFEIILYIMQDSYPEVIEIRQFRFEGVHVDGRAFQMDSEGYALSTYTFTADGVLSDQAQVVE